MGRTANFLVYILQFTLLLNLCLADLELVDPTTIATAITLSGTDTYRIYSNGDPADFQFLCPSPIVTRVTLNVPFPSFLISSLHFHFSFFILFDCFTPYFFPFSFSSK